jgi:hypothetical protein
VLAGCGGSGTPDPPTGLGATRDAWAAHHGAGYSSVLTDAAGHVEGYLLTMGARSLDQAEALVRRDLPADATTSTARLTSSTESARCEIVEFTSPTLGRLLGGGHGDQVMAAFQSENATILDTARITRAVVVSGNEGLPRQC